MVHRNVVLFALSFLSALAAGAVSTSAKTIDRFCSITASGDACIFTLRTMGSGNLSVSTKSHLPGQRWRTTIARLNTGETVGKVNLGSAAAFTGAAVRSAASNVSFVVIVSLEGVPRDPLNASVIVRFNGPFVTVFGPRPNLGDNLSRPTCPDTTDICRLCQNSAVLVVPRTPTFSTLNIFAEPYTSPAMR